eukprot:scaffold19534_cov50-Phaeocystis_antarctica.AAC.1
MVPKKTVSYRPPGPGFNKAKSVSAMVSAPRRTCTVRESRVPTSECPPRHPTHMTYENRKGKSRSNPNRNRRTAPGRKSCVCATRQLRLMPQYQLELRTRPHLLEHPLPLARDLVRRAQELAHPLHHGAQLGGGRGRAVGLRVPQPRGDRLGLEGVRVLRPKPLAQDDHQRAQLLLRLGQPPLRQPQLDQSRVAGAAVAAVLPEPRHRLDQQRLGLRQLVLRQEHLAEAAGGQHRVQVVVAQDLAPRCQRLAEQRLRLGQLALLPQVVRQPAERRQRVRGPVPELCPPQHQLLSLERLGLREPPLVLQHRRHVVHQKRRAALRLGHRLQHRLRLADHPPA